MKRLTQEEISATHRIFNHVESLIGPYYGRKTVDEAKEYVSANRWIMFPAFNITSLREGTTYPIPNVFVSFENEVRDNRTGQVDGWIGVTCNNSDAMLWLKDTLRKKSPYLMNILNNIGDEWSVEIQQKIKTDYYESTPYYETIQEFKPSIVTPDDINAGIDMSNKHLPQQGDSYKQSHSVLSAITVFTVLKTTTIRTFDDDVKKAFDLFFKMIGKYNVTG
jgi:hypothetical protein